MRPHEEAAPRDGLEVGYELDRLWSETMAINDVETKEGPLRAVAELLAREGTPYALIGGVAVQVHTKEPRTTLDIDLAILAYADIPRDALLRAGFTHTGRHDHSDNWRAPGSGPTNHRTAIQFSAEDEGIVEAVEQAIIVDLGGRLRLRVANVPSLVVLKLAAAEEPTRRASKRQHDLGDVLALMEEHPQVATPELRARLERVRRGLLAPG